MAIPVTIETKDFKTKTETMRHFTEMLARHGNRDKITGEDLDDLLNLIKNHPRYNEKVGSEFIRSTQTFNTAHAASGLRGPMGRRKISQSENVLTAQARESLGNAGLSAMEPAKPN